MLRVAISVRQIGSTMRDRVIISWFLMKSKHNTALTSNTHTTQTTDFIILFVSELLSFGGSRSLSGGSGISRGDSGMPSENLIVATTC